MVRFLRVLSSLYSVQMIVISALLITYLTMTTANRTAAKNGNAPVAEQEDTNEKVAVGGPASWKTGIHAVTSQPLAIGKDLGALAGFETAPVTWQTISNLEIAAESWETKADLDRFSRFSTTEPMRER